MYTEKKGVCCFFWNGVMFGPIKIKIQIFLSGKEKDRNQLNIPKFEWKEKRLEFGYKLANEDIVLDF